MVLHDNLLSCLMSDGQDRFHFQNMFDGQRYRSCESPSVCVKSLDGKRRFDLGPDPVGYCQEEFCATLGALSASGSPVFERFSLPTPEPETEFFQRWVRSVPLSLVLVYAAAGGRVTYPPFACVPYDSTATPVTGSCTDQVK
jgi:hypothetical protein